MTAPFLRLLSALLLALAGLLVVAPARAQDSSPDARPRSSVMLLFDSSGSMSRGDGTGRKKIDRAKQAIQSLVEGSPPGAKVGLRVFGGRYSNKDKKRGCTDSRAIFPVGAVDAEATRDALRSYRPTGFTPIALSLEKAAEDLPPGGRRTIILVSDGEDTCAPPQPCDVARRIARGGISLKIQAIGFRVDPKAKRQLQCIARAGGGVYRDVQNAPRLAEELRALSIRALRDYIPRGKPVKGGATARQATEIQPGQYLDEIDPDETKWYAIELGERETVEAAATLVAPDRRKDVDAIGARFEMELLNPAVQRAETNNSSADDGSVFDRRDDGAIDSVGVVGRPIGVGEQLDPDATFRKPGRYYLRVRLEDSNAKELFDQLDGRPAKLELLVSVLGREGGEVKASGSGAAEDGAARPPTGASPTSEEPSSLVLALVALGAAALGAGAGAAALRRRRAT